MALDKLLYLEQNWNDQDRDWFYYADQGSRLIAERIFMNLEQVDNEKLFSDSFHLLGFGFLPYPETVNNPLALPIGISRNGEHLGLTCAACHTQQIKYRSQYIRIDGGQGMLDLPAFLAALAASMEATLNDEDKYSRFELRVLGTDAVASKRIQLKTQLQDEYEKRKDYNHRNRAQVAYGYSRLDAFGAILNKGLYLTGVKDNFNEPNAPTSYPYIWDTPQHDYVEWDGSQSNSDIGALARNVGEVIGVYGDVNVKPVRRLLFFDGGYESSINAKNLRELEMKVASLHSPLWPELFPAPDMNRVVEGRTIYKQYCLACHEDIDRTDKTRKIKVRMSSLKKIGTDPLMAENAIYRRGKTGVFAGRPRFYKAGEIMGEEAPALFIVNNLMGGVLTNNPLQSYLAIRDANNMGHAKEIHPPKYLDGEPLPRGQEVSEKALLAYKARPLNGIWAGAPYLHNGSVPNLYELLLPAEQRSQQFYIGSWEFDPERVGYVSEYRDGSFLFDTRLQGNSNRGHEYGTGKDGLSPLTAKQISALLEYLKTL